MLSRCVALFRRPRPPAPKPPGVVFGCDAGDWPAEAPDEARGLLRRFDGGLSGALVSSDAQRGPNAAGWHGRGASVGAGGRQRRAACGCSRWGAMGQATVTTVHPGGHPFGWWPPDCHVTMQTAYVCTKGPTAIVSHPRVRFGGSLKYWISNYAYLPNQEPKWNNGRTIRLLMESRSK